MRTHALLHTPTFMCTCVRAHTQTRTHTKKHTHSVQITKVTTFLTKTESVGMGKEKRNEDHRMGWLNFTKTDFNGLRKYIVKKD